ncbi:MAG: ABC transporter substrate-binding protein [Anaerolineae bacterium]
MKTMRVLSAIILLSLAMSLLAACAQPTEAPTEETVEATTEAPTEEATEEPTEEAAEAEEFVTWYQYDQNNTDPAADEHVGNMYLHETMPQFNEAFAGKWQWINQPKAFDKMAAELVAAVQAGGEVPDLYELNSDKLNTLYRNGALQDLTEWATAQAWFDDLDASAVEACKGADGGLYCIPISQRPQITYVWADYFPEGYPKTPEAFLEKAAELKEDGVYIMTFYGSTDKGGSGYKRAVNTTIDSFGGRIDDGEGNMLVNRPEVIAAIEFLRELVAQEYVPEVTFAGGFQEEQAFKDASAASFPSGLNGYRYLNPLTAPDGTAYDKNNEEDVLDAVANGDMMLSPFISVEGEEPGCDTQVAGLAIPVGAENPEAAYDYINWIMEPERNAEWVLGPGGGFPVLGATQNHELFQAPFFQQAAAAVSASSCRPWFGSLENPEEAQRLLMNAVYQLIKEDPTADIAETLQRVQEEYNAGN